jgi:hypothetical protein
MHDECGRLHDGYEPKNNDLDRVVEKLVQSAGRVNAPSGRAGRVNALVGLTLFHDSNQGVGEEEKALRPE